MMKTIIEYIQKKNISKFVSGNNTNYGRGNINADINSIKDVNQGDYFEFKFIYGKQNNLGVAYGKLNNKTRFGQRCYFAVNALNAVYVNIQVTAGQHQVYPITADHAKILDEISDFLEKQNINFETVRNNYQIGKVENNKFIPTL